MNEASDRDWVAPPRPTLGPWTRGHQVPERPQPRIDLRLPPSGIDNTALCLDHDPDLWFKGKREAQLICAQCPLKHICRELGEREPYGTWGGVAPSERQEAHRKGVPTRSPAPSVYRRPRRTHKRVHHPAVTYLDEHRARKPEKRQCIYLLDNGVTCNRGTSHPTQMCWDHRNA